MLEYGHDIGEHKFDGMIWQKMGVWKLKKN